MNPVQTTHVNDGVKMAYEALVVMGYDFTKMDEMESESDTCNDSR